MEVIVAKYWYLIAAVGGFIVWFVRLEAKAIANEKEIGRLWRQRKEDMDAAKEARNETNARLDIIQSDIKTLIKNTSEGRK